MCPKSIQLSTSRRSALTDHNNGEKTKDAASKVANFFKPRGSKKIKSLFNLFSLIKPLAVSKSLINLSLPAVHLKQRLFGY